MINDTYPLYPSKNKVQFAFESVGIQGKIVKIIVFSPIGENEWNLGFGDLHKGKVDDLVISNNQDAMKIIRTVSKATLEFCELHPESIIQIKPVDEKRKKLYNLVFQKYFTLIDPYFSVKGYIDNNEESYSSETFYDYFKISYKFVK